MPPCCLKLYSRTHGVEERNAEKSGESGPVIVFKTHHIDLAEKNRLQTCSPTKNLDRRTAACLSPALSSLSPFIYRLPPLLLHKINTSSFFNPTTIKNAILRRVYRLWNHQQQVHYLQRGRELFSTILPLAQMWGNDTYSVDLSIGGGRCHISKS